LRRRSWEVACPGCDAPLAPLPTDEDKPLFPTSVYATTKRDQEEMFCEIGMAYQIPTAVLRYFNIYGPRQALSNPYTGVIAIFSNCLLGAEQPVVFEDGLQSRDFTHVQDVVQANLLALERHHAGVRLYNVGTGTPTSLLELLETLSRALGLPPGQWGPSQRFRAGDIRHCYADITRIRRELGFEPSMTLERGMQDMAAWLVSQRSSRVLAEAVAELEAKGLVV
jgi:dTDP-L-rhamnose 4-epimerase